MMNIYENDGDDGFEDKDDGGKKCFPVASRCWVWSMLVIIMMMMVMLVLRIKMIMNNDEFH